MAKDAGSEQTRFGLFDGLVEEAYGMLPLANLTARGGPTSMKQYKRLASYNWYLEEQNKPVIVTPGAPLDLHHWTGGLLQNDQGVLIYDIHHAKLPLACLDPMVLCTKQQNPNINFQDFDIVTDTVNLQKLFAFCKNEGDGLFRIDVERVGNTLYLNRVEASDFMQIDYETYDQHLKMKCCRATGKLTAGPHFQIVSAQFGKIKCLLRHEVDCREMDPKTKIEAKDNDDSLERETFEENPDLEYIVAGGTSKADKLMHLTTYPTGQGFPFFSWAQLFFSGADNMLIGWYKPGQRGDFAKPPAMYPMMEVNKLMKPMPYPVIGKVHDCLQKLKTFMKTNVDELRVSLIWKGGTELEIYQRTDHRHSLPLSKGVKAYLVSQCEPSDGVIPE